MPICHITLIGQKPLPDAYPVELRTLGDHLRKRRLDLGLTQQEVAEKINTTEATIRNWELHHRSTDIRYIPSIISFLGYDPCARQSGTQGERIIAYRRKVGLTQEQLARQLGIDPETLGRWEREENQPSPKLRKRLAGFPPFAQDD